MDMIAKGRSKLSLHSRVFDGHRQGRVGRAPKGETSSCVLRRCLSDFS